LLKKEADPKGETEFNRVVIEHHSTGKEHTLLAKQAPRVFAVPSHNGKYHALSFFGSDVVRRKTVVISDLVELVGKIDFAD
jgi:hypothetical protein